MTYTFSIQLTGGVDVKFGLTAPGRPLLGAEVSGAMQKINTMVIVLNGVEAYDWYLAQDGGTINKEAQAAADDQGQWRCGTFADLHWT